MKHRDEQIPLFVCSSRLNKAKGFLIFVPTKEHLFLYLYIALYFKLQHHNIWTELHSACVIPKLNISYVHVSWLIRAWPWLASTVGKVVSAFFLFHSGLDEAWIWWLIIEFFSFKLYPPQEFDPLSLDAVRISRTTHPFGW